MIGAARGRGRAAPGSFMSSSAPTAPSTSGSRRTWRRASPVTTRAGARATRGRASRCGSSTRRGSPTSAPPSAESARSSAGRGPRRSSGSDFRRAGGSRGPGPRPEDRQPAPAGNAPAWERRPRVRRRRSRPAGTVKLPIRMMSRCSCAGRYQELRVNRCFVEVLGPPAQEAALTFSDIPVGCAFDGPRGGRGRPPSAAEQEVGHRRPALRLPRPHEVPRLRERLDGRARHR